MNEEKDLKIIQISNGFVEMMKGFWGNQDLEVPNSIDIENNKKQALSDLMKDMPLQTLHIAYLYAKNYAEYGEDVTKTWITAAEQSSALEKAYKKGYYDALNRQAESEE